ncbi:MULTISPECIES: flagellar export chaperone FliS [Azospira]|jgi:flagellar secretion chaperone FliS|uniref:Flagellar secretion chaperone FliS n=2 Tax=Azospira oryzae TaxID=146939 RepID=G8QGM9_AZOOP|nr:MULTISPECIES: flagellar export chaperone FliS [Azospira]AEV26165.1 flagellar biosynthetic protein FliS [Azospira oryzae PS]MDK9692591.1 flagellar export chaperone FliS [Azospira sp.]RZT75566.1 flagellar protein FliS [Azospira oryzae]
MFNQGVRAYAQVKVETAVSTANPVQLVVLLYEGAISAIASAKGEMERRNIAQKAQFINKAIDIIEGLRNALEFSQGGDIAVSLNDLYLYMVQRLSTANLKNDPAILDEVTALLRELLGAWEVLAKGTADGIDDDSTAPNDGNVLTKA